MPIGKNNKNINRRPPKPAVPGVPKPPQPAVPGIPLPPKQIIPKGVSRPPKQKPRPGQQPQQIPSTRSECPNPGSLASAGLTTSPFAGMTRNETRECLCPYADNLGCVNCEIDGVSDNGEGYICESNICSGGSNAGGDCSENGDADCPCYLGDAACEDPPVNGFSHGTIVTGCDGGPEYDDGEWPGGCWYPLNEAEFDGVSCCDEASVVFGVTCKFLEEQYGVFCGGCKCPNDEATEDRPSCSWSFKPVLGSLGYGGDSFGWNITDDSCQDGCRDISCTDYDDFVHSVWDDDLNGADGWVLDIEPIIEYTPNAQGAFGFTENNVASTTRTWAEWSQTICAKSNFCREDYSDCDLYDDEDSCNNNSVSNCGWILDGDECVYLNCQYYNHCMMSRNIGLAANFCVDNCVNDGSLCAPDSDEDGVCDEDDEYPDCAANYYDCADVCGGDAVENICGDCNGGYINTNCSCVLGDVNQDGGFNVLDIVTLANIILDDTCDHYNDGHDNHEFPSNCCNGDLNEDGGLNVLDIVTLANCILANNCNGRQGGSADALALALQPVTPMNIPPGSEDEAEAIQRVADLGRIMIEENKTALQQNTAIEGWEDTLDLQNMIDILSPFTSNPKIWRPVNNNTTRDPGDPCDCFGAVCDACDVCGGDGSSCSDCPSGNYDCAGVCDGNAQTDCCSECDGDGSTCQDCAGVCWGSAVIDECGVCGGDGIADGACDCDGNTEDCAGECGGSAVEDECGVCGGPGETGCWDGSTVCPGTNCPPVYGCNIFTGNCEVNGTAGEYASSDCNNQCGGGMCDDDISTANCGSLCMSLANGAGGPPCTGGSGTWCTPDTYCAGMPGFEDGNWCQCLWADEWDSCPGLTVDCCGICEKGGKLQSGGRTQPVSRKMTQVKESGRTKLQPKRMTQGGTINQQPCPPGYTLTSDENCIPG